MDIINDPVQFRMAAYYVRREFGYQDRDLVEKFIKSHCFTYLEIFEKLAQRVGTYTTMGPKMPTHLRDYFQYATSKYEELSRPLRFISMARINIVGVMETSQVPNDITNANERANSLARLATLGQVTINNERAKTSWIIKYTYNYLRRSMQGGLFGPAFAYHNQREQILSNQRMIILNYFIFDRLEEQYLYIKEFFEAIRNLRLLLQTDDIDTTLLNIIKENNLHSSLENMYYKAKDIKISANLKTVLEILDSLN